MYRVNCSGKTNLEADACGIGFVATRGGLANRGTVDFGIHLCAQFDHRGAPGHGSGVILDIPWSLMESRFPDYADRVQAKDVAVGAFFLPRDKNLYEECVRRIERVARSAGADVLAWAEVPVELNALAEGSHARNSCPEIRHALFRHPEGLSNEGWFACRYLLRLAIEAALEDLPTDEYSILSLSNRTIVYKGLSELSRIADFFLDLKRTDVESRFFLFHSRYCTNTTTAWSRAQPFWVLAHNGEISTIDGNTEWFRSIGASLVDGISEQFPTLAPLADQVRSVICEGGSDSQVLDDMTIALVASGLTMSQSLLALLPEARPAVLDERVRAFYESTSLYFGACDGPAAVVACDGDEAVAHLDRNGLRPLWFLSSPNYAIALSELTGTFPTEEFSEQRILSPGETVRVDLLSGDVHPDEEVKREVAVRGFPNRPRKRAASKPTVKPRSAPWPDPLLQWPLATIQAAFGMGKEDLDVLLAPMRKFGKAAVGSMGDDTSPSAILDRYPRRPEDYFALRFAQETSPPIDPIRDAWVFDPTGFLGDRSGYWSTEAPRAVFRLEHRVLSNEELAQFLKRPGVAFVDATCPPDEGISIAIDRLVQQCRDMASDCSVLVLSDRGIGPNCAAVPMVRLVSRVHQAFVDDGNRHRIGIVADAGIWDIHPCALYLTLGADAVCPWLGLVSAEKDNCAYLNAVRTGLIETMSMMGVTPSTAYCGARLVESIGLDRDFLDREFRGIPGHLGGIGEEDWNSGWLAMHRSAFGEEIPGLPDFGEFRHSKDGRPHANNAEIVRSLHAASGYAKKIHSAPPGSLEAFRDYSRLVSEREAITVLDCLEVVPSRPIPIEEVEPVERILWRFMAPGMSEGALSEPAHRAIARAFNVLHRYCRIRLGYEPTGIGPIANSGEGGFDKSRIGTLDGNRSVQYAGGRFTITPSTAAKAAEAEVKFAQGAKPGKGGQLPGKKVSPLVAARRGCEPGYELVSPPINHNLYSIEDVKLMVESWRHLNPNVNAALKFVATHGIEMVCMGGVNAGANRLHISDGCGGTGAAKRVDQKHGGIPVAAVLPKVQDTLVEEGVRHLVEVSVDGGVQSGEQALKLMLLGADRVGFGTSLLIAIGCSMLRKCHLAGPDPADQTGRRRLGCMPGVATQDPALVAKFEGKAKHIARYLTFVAGEVRERMAAAGIRSLDEVIGHRQLLRRKPNLTGKAAKLDLSHLLEPPTSFEVRRDYRKQTEAHMPRMFESEATDAEAALAGIPVERSACLTNAHRCVGIRAIGIVARANGDQGLKRGSLSYRHRGSAGHYYAAYCLPGFSFYLEGNAGDSAFTAAYGGRLVIVPELGKSRPAIAGNTFGYGARGGEAFLAGCAGNRFAICARKSHEGGGPLFVVEGVGANAFQYMTGGVALVLGPTGPNLGAGMTGGVVYLLEPNLDRLNADYVAASPLTAEDEVAVRDLLRKHFEATHSEMAASLLDDFQSSRFMACRTKLVAEPIED